MTKKFRKLLGVSMIGIPVVLFVYYVFTSGTIMNLIFAIGAVLAIALTMFVIMYGYYLIVSDDDDNFFDDWWI